MGDGVVVALGVALVAFQLGWLSAGFWRAVHQEARRRRIAELNKAEDARLGVPATGHKPREAMFYLAFSGTSGLWSIGDTDREARKLAVERWTRLGEGLPPELRVDDPTAEEWAANLTIVYVETESEAVMEHIVVPSFSDHDMAPTPWNPEPHDGRWEEA